MIERRFGMRSVPRATAVLSVIGLVWFAVGDALQEPNVHLTTLLYTDVIVVVFVVVILASVAVRPRVSVSGELRAGTDAVWVAFLALALMSAVTPIVCLSTWSVGALGSGGSRTLLARLGVCSSLMGSTLVSVAGGVAWGFGVGAAMRRVRRQLSRRAAWRPYLPMGMAPLPDRSRLIKQHLLIPVLTYLLLGWAAAVPLLLRLRGLP